MIEAYYKDAYGGRVCGVPLFIILGVLMGNGVWCSIYYMMYLWGKGRIYFIWNIYGGRVCCAAFIIGGTYGGKVCGIAFCYLTWGTYEGNMWGADFIILFPTDLQFIKDMPSRTQKDDKNQIS